MTTEERPIGRVRNGIRQNPETRKSLEMRLVPLTQAEARLTEILSLKDSPAWKHIMDDFLVKIGEIDVKLGKFETLTQEARAILLKERKDWTELLNYMSMKEQELDRIGQSISSARRDLKARDAE